MKVCARSMPRAVRFVESKVRDWTRPDRAASLLLGLMVDFTRSEADTTGITVVHASVQAPRANAMCEGFVGSMRRECLDHLLIPGERHFHAVPTEYVNYVNHARPHQGLGQRIPSGVRHPSTAHGRVVGFPVLGGLHHDYRLAA